MDSEKLLSNNLKAKGANKVSRVLNNKKKEINLVYEYQENEEGLNRVFDIIFEEVIKRRKEKQGY